MFNARLFLRASAIGTFKACCKLQLWAKSLQVLATQKVAKMLPRGGKFGKNKKSLCALLSTRCLGLWWGENTRQWCKNPTPVWAKCTFLPTNASLQLLQRLQVLLSVAQNVVLATIRFVLQTFAKAFCVSFCQ